MAGLLLMVALGILTAVCGRAGTGKAMPNILNCSAGSRPNILRTGNATQLLGGW